MYIYREETKARRNACEKARRVFVSPQQNDYVILLRYLLSLFNEEREVTMNTVQYAVSLFTNRQWVWSKAGIKAIMAAGQATFEQEDIEHEREVFAGGSMVKELLLCMGRIHGLLMSKSL